MADLEKISENRCFDGSQFVYKHSSDALKCDMRFSLYVPDKAQTEAVPLVIFLSGLTCTEENATIKAGFQRLASKLEMMVLCPDTSPRGEGVANDDRYNMGQGAGFYLNATQQPWAAHFQMESYITDELYKLVTSSFNIADGKVGITGHSMGGHGALCLAMKHPDLFQSLSAFAPITSAPNLDWSKVALEAYLGEGADFSDHDACALVKSKGWKGSILVDQGEADQFLESGLRPDWLKAACDEAGQAAQIDLQPGHDHSYYFIASFMEKHMRFHADILKA